MLSVMIGWDAREAIAADVCRFSLLRHSSVALRVEMLKQEDLRQQGLYSRTFTVRDGQRYDDTDGRPFSTEFSFTRFLVPWLRSFDGWALFCDCDFLFAADIGELVPLMDWHKAVMVCKQRHVPAESTKMDGVAQAAYPRKNWSSFVLWNCGHPSNRRHLTLDDVNTASGRWLHSFGWLEPHEIGDLPHEWNFIDGVTEGEPKAVHFTSGGCWFPGYESVAYADEWRNELDLMRTRALRGVA